MKKHPLLFSIGASVILAIIHLFLSEVLWSIHFCKALISNLVSHVYFYISIPGAFIQKTFFPCQGLECIQNIIIEPLLLFLIYIIFGAVIGFLIAKEKISKKVTKYLVIVIIIYHIVLPIGAGVALYAAQNTKTYCDLCPEEGVSNSCYSRIAMIKGDESYCLYMGEGNYQISCIAQATRDISVCEKADNSGQQPYGTQSCKKSVQRVLDSQ